MTFEAQIEAHIKHIVSVAPLCTNEEITKQALILPFFNLLGFAPFDPSQVQAEYRSNLVGIKSTERVDYALFKDEKPIMFVEVKSLNHDIKKHSSQLARYFNASIDVSICAITNGKQWYFYTDLLNKNIMDSEPFFKLDFDSLVITDIEKLQNFHRDKFQYTELLKLAHDNIFSNNYNNFVSSLRKSLINLDDDFIEFIIGKSGMNKISKQYFESLKPTFEKALADILKEINSEFDLLFELREILEPLNIKLDAELIDDSYLFYINNDKNQWIFKYFNQNNHQRILLPFHLNDADINNINLTGLNVENSYIILKRPIDIIRIAFILIGIAQNK